MVYERPGNSSDAALISVCILKCYLKHVHLEELIVINMAYIIIVEEEPLGSAWSCIFSSCSHKSVTKITRNNNKTASEHGTVLCPVTGRRTLTQGHALLCYRQHAKPCFTTLTLHIGILLVYLELYNHLCSVCLEAVAAALCVFLLTVLHFPR